MLGHALGDAAAHLLGLRADPAANRLNTESGKIVLGSAPLGKAGLTECGACPQWFEPAEWLGRIDAGDIGAQPAALVRRWNRRGVADSHLAGPA